MANTIKKYKYNNYKQTNKLYNKIFYINIYDKNYKTFFWQNYTKLFKSFFDIR